MKRGFSMMLLLAATVSAWSLSPAFADEPVAAAPAVTASPAATVEPARTVAPGHEPGMADIAPEIVATVNGKPISRDQLAALCIHFEGKAGLETLIQYELIRQEAAKEGVTVTPEEVAAHTRKAAEDRLDARARMNGAKDFADWAAKNGLKPEDVARRVHDEADWLRPFAEPELLAKKILLKSVKVTDADVRAEFDRRYGPKARVLQIVVRSEADAEDVIKKLSLGADFAEMARDVSVDNVSRRKGGEIPPIGPGSPLGDAAFKLKPGQFSDPVKTPDGFHVIKLLEMMPAVDKRLEDVKGDIQESLTALQLSERREKWLDGLFDTAAIKRNL
ncbi:MAG: peptidyl-prolyl cis-trans isomerase [Candidatus Brocadiia bacterium]|jgi:foldase protein PrsA